MRTALEIIRYVIVISAIAFNAECFAQLTITGSVLSDETKAPLSWVNISVIGTNYGTVTDNNGRFRIVLPMESARLKISCIGYRSKTILVRSNQDIRVRLSEETIKTPEVTITQYDSAALSIIRRSIQTYEQLDYQYPTHAARYQMQLRMVLLSNQLSDSLPSDDYKFDLIGGVRFQSGDTYSDTVLARRVCLGSFGDDPNRLLGVVMIGLNKLYEKHPYGILGPMSDEGMKKYIFHLTDSTTIDSTSVAVIHFSPMEDEAPLMHGVLYIELEHYFLVRAEMELEDMALHRGPLADHKFFGLAISQTYRKIGDSLWLPTATEVRQVNRVAFLTAESMTVATVSKCIFTDHSLSPGIETGYNNHVVLPGAYERDSIFWAMNSIFLDDWSCPRLPDSVLNQTTDSVIVQREESPQNVIRSFVEGEKWSSGDMEFLPPSLLEIHFFNRVQGYNINYPITVRHLFTKYDELYTLGGYGFSDRRWKYDVKYGIRVPIFLFTNFSMRTYQSISSLEENHDQWTQHISSLSSMLAKYDYKQYYYSKGHELGVVTDIAGSIDMKLQVGYRHNTKAANQSDWSLLKKNWSYMENIELDETRMYSYKLELRRQKSSYYEHDGYRERILEVSSFRPFLGVEYLTTTNAQSQWNSIIAHAGIDGSFLHGNIGLISYGINAAYSSEKLPPEKLITLPGTVRYITGNNRFRTLGYREYGGEKSFQLMIDYMFYDKLFSLLPIPVLRDIDMTLHLFYNLGYSEIGDASKGLLHEELVGTKYPFQETGFRISQIFSVLTFDAAWRLNHFRDGRNFYFGFSLTLPSGITFR